MNNSCIDIMNTNSTSLDVNNISGYLALVGALIIISINVACIFCCKPTAYSIIKTSDAGVYREI
jgi:hypothetical protein